jgi:DNA-binding transcriptional MocR family regulator
MRPDALRALLARTVVALVYLMPGCHSPTGASIALGRRPALLAVAEQHDTLIVEDAALDKLRFDGPLPSLRSLAPARVLRVGSLDKLAWAGLRIGWICGPRELIGRLARMKAARDLGTGVLAQLAALALLRDVDALRTARVAQARRRASLLRDELARRIPSWTIPLPEGGWSLWATLPAAAGIDGGALAAAAARHGVHVAPGRPHFPADAEGAGERVAAIRIAYPAEEPSLVEGAARLAAAWSALAGTTSSQSANRGSRPWTASR